MSVIPNDPMRSLSRWIRFTNNVDVGVCQNYDYEGRIQLTSDTEWNNPGTASGRNVNLPTFISSQFKAQFDLQFDNSYTCNVRNSEIYAPIKTVVCSEIELQKNIVKGSAWIHSAMSELHL